jgi:hypothetical protein
MFVFEAIEFTTEVDDAIWENKLLCDIEEVTTLDLNAVVGMRLVSSATVETSLVSDSAVDTRLVSDTCSLEDTMLVSDNTVNTELVSMVTLPVVDEVSITLSPKSRESKSFI